jgi:hypothetical protein
MKWTKEMAKRPTQAKKTDAYDKSVRMVIILSAHPTAATTIQPAYQLHQPKF